MDQRPHREKSSIVLSMVNPNGILAVQVPGAFTFRKSAQDLRAFLQSIGCGVVMLVVWLRDTMEK